MRVIKSRNLFVVRTCEERDMLQEFFPDWYVAAIGERYCGIGFNRIVIAFTPSDDELKYLKEYVLPRAILRDKVVFLGCSNTDFLEETVC